MSAKALISRVMPAQTFLVLRHWLRFRRLPALRPPQSFNEHILSLMLSRKDAALRRVFADKLATRDYVAARLGAGWLPELFAVHDRAEAIDFSALPERYVMKASHGSGMTRLVPGAGGEDARSLRALARQWLATDFYWHGKEYVYRGLPRRVLFEELLFDADKGRPPDDLKIYMFGGRPGLVHVDVDRFGTYRRALYTPDWQRVPAVITYPDYEGEVPRPANLEAMLEAARVLAGDLDFLRVDLYDLGSRIVVGELTNFPGAGNMLFSPPAFDRELGRLFSAPGRAATVA